MEDVAHWPSLTDQGRLSEALFGTSAPVAEWLAAQVRLVDDVDFAREFTAHMHLPGVTELEYSHRLVRTSRGDLLGGIRFYGRDISRPFVEVLAHDFDDLRALADCVRKEWSNFGVRYLRVRTRPRLLTERPDVTLDKTIHVARYGTMTPADDRVTLGRFDTAEQAVDLIAARYAQLADTDPTLSRNLSRSDPDDIRRWHEADQLRAIMFQDRVIGALAVVPGAVGWIAGGVVHEEVMDTRHAGRGYAASAQAAWAQFMAADCTQLLIGTIDRHNHASRATALRAGRSRLLDDVFVAL